MLGFGHEDQTVRVFYAAFQTTITSAVQWEWFTAAWEVLQTLPPEGLEQDNGLDEPALGEIALVFAPAQVGLHQGY